MAELASNIEITLVSSPPAAAHAVPSYCALMSAAKPVGATLKFDATITAAMLNLLSTHDDQGRPCSDPAKSLLSQCQTPVNSGARAGDHSRPPVEVRLDIVLCDLQTPNPLLSALNELAQPIWDALLRQARLDGRVALGRCYQVNVFNTGVNSRTACHTDGLEILAVVQLIGTKQWHLLPHSVLTHADKGEWPHECVRNHAGRNDLRNFVSDEFLDQAISNKVATEYLLSPNMALLIPSLVPHAVSGDELSLHLTFSCSLASHTFLPRSVASLADTTPSVYASIDLMRNTDVAAAATTDIVSQPFRRGRVPLPLPADLEHNWVQTPHSSKWTCAFCKIAVETVRRQFNAGCVVGMCEQKPARSSGRPPTNRTSENGFGSACADRDASGAH